MHELPGLLPPEHRQRGRDPVQHALDVGVDHLVPVVDPQRVQRRDQAHADVADQDVQAAEALLRQRGQPGHVGPAPHVGGLVSGLSPAIGDAACHCLQPLQPPGAQDDPGSLPGQQLGRGRPDPAARSGDGHDLALDACRHQYPSAVNGHLSGSPWRLPDKCPLSNTRQFYTSNGRRTADSEWVASMRSDAELNRARIIEAAVAALATSSDATLNSIAKRAGVGQGTTYRHFPNREALLLAVYRQDVQTVIDAAPALLADYPPAEALRRWFGRWRATGGSSTGWLRRWRRRPGRPVQRRLPAGDRRDHPAAGRPARPPTRSGPTSTPTRCCYWWASCGASTTTTGNGARPTCSTW